MRNDKERRFLGLQVSGDLVAVLDEEARAEGLSRSDVIRRALLRHVRQAPAVAGVVEGARALPAEVAP